MCTVVLSVEKYLYTDFKYKDESRLTGVNVKPVCQNSATVRMDALRIPQEKYSPFPLGLGLHEAG